MPQPVDGCGIDPVDAFVQCLADSRNRVLVVLRPPGEFPSRSPDRPSPEADRGMCRSEFPSGFVFMMTFSLAVAEVPIEDVAARATVVFLLGSGILSKIGHAGKMAMPQARFLKQLRIEYGVTGLYNAPLGYENVAMFHCSLAVENRFS